MKKLMMTAAAVALAGVATASNVFDYKASVKYVDFKSVKVDGDKTWVKTVKSTTLKGYLVTPQNCACAAPACATREPGFLVLTSSLAKKYDKSRQVKLMPANLLADMWTQKSILGTTKSATFEAQGYLFAGLGKSDMPSPAGTQIYGFGDKDVTVATKYLFGQGNIDEEVDNEDEDDPTFIEPFLDAAGFGKAGYSSTEDPLCGKGTKGWCLKSLSGSVIGGSWTCMANGISDEMFRCQGWNNEAIASGTQIDYSGHPHMYNVISGTWSIKENKKIEAATLDDDENTLLVNGVESVSERGTASKATAQLVKACGQKLQKDFSLADFDGDANAKKARGAFVAKWFADPTAD